MTADKRTQMAKERRVRDAGGRHIRTRRGEVVEVPESTVRRYP